MIKKYSPEDIAGVIDHTLLRPDAVEDDILRLCDEAGRCGFYSVCIHPSFTALARKRLERSGIKVSTVIGFPLGATHTSVKTYEAIESVFYGAGELDIVINIGMAKAGRWEGIRGELRSIVMATPSVIHKVIVETGYLTDKEIKSASLAALDAGAGFIKTSTGFGPRGATLEDVAVIRDAVGNRALIKAAGGIRSLEGVISFLEAGADRIGTSSGVAIMEEALSAL